MTLALLQKEFDGAQDSGCELQVARLMRLALVVEYDGKHYAGSQLQKNRPTIQSELESALAQLTAEKIRVSLASRTDAGVHARGQVVSFNTASTLPIRTFVSGLNHYLPGDIAVKAASEVDAGFDPRRRALKREYEYYILNSAPRSPLWEGRAYQVAGKLDIEAMSQGCLLLIGEHDFASFATGMAGLKKSTVRRMYAADARREGEQVITRMAANAFLPHQVRNTVGALISLGQGRMTLAEFEGMMRACQPGLAGPAVPACGLYLTKVYYGNNFEEGFNENLQRQGK